MIEASFFSTIQDGARAAEAMYYLCLAAGRGVGLGVLFGGTGSAPGLRSGGAASWMGRTLTAWLSWPAIYLVFGMSVAPVVVEYYKEIPWLRIPPLGTIVEIHPSLRYGMTLL